MSDIMVVGIVVNPKLKKPVLVTYDGSEIDMWCLDRNGGRIGGGSYEAHDEDYLAPAHATGLPRVHTPGGVSPKGKGYGTSLYTALCLGAHQNHEGELDLDLLFEGDGVSSSSDTRSASASQWWRQAARMKLVDHVSDEVVREDVEFDGYDLYGCKDGDDNEVEISYARGDITTYVEADAYYFESATKSDLVVASFFVEMRESALILRQTAEHATSTTPRKVVRTLNPNALRHIWKTLAEDTSLVYEVWDDPLLALDVRNLEPHAVNLLSTLAVDVGARDDDIDDLRMRAELNLDPSTPIKQMKLPFTPNASEASVIKGALDAAKKRRARLDWDRLSSLP